MRGMYTYIHTDDDEEYAILHALLSEVGIAVYEERTITEILVRWFAQPADLLVVATDEDTLLTMTGQIRVITPVPLVMIASGAIAVESKIALFDAGVDLIIKRPYRVRTLVPQLRNLARRGRSIPLTQLGKSQTADWLVDPTVRMVQRADGLQMTLSQREFELFFLLYSHQRQTLTKNQIIEAVWGYTGHGDENALRTLIKQVRRKIETTPEQPQYLLSVQGVGYKLLLG